MLQLSWHVVNITAAASEASEASSEFTNQGYTADVESAMESVGQNSVPMWLKAVSAAEVTKT